MKSKIIILVLILALTIGGFFMLKPIFKNNSLKKQELNSVRYTVGGGMLGGLSRSSLEKQKDGSIKYITEYAETHSDRIVTRIYNASIHDLNNIKDLIIKYNLYRASKKPLSKIQVLDGDTSTLTVSFDDEYFSVSDTQAISTNDFKHIQEIVQLMASCAKGEYIEEIENHILALYVGGYQVAYEMENSIAVEQLLENEGQYPTDDYQSVGKYMIIDKEFDFSDCSSIKDIKAGNLCFDDINKRLIFFYEDVVLDDELYYLGHLENAFDSTIDFIKQMPHTDNGIYKRK